MAGRPPSRLLVAVSVVALAAALTAMRLRVFPPQRLDAPDETTTGTTGPLGERTYIFVGPFYVKGSDPVYVRDVRLTGVPRGMRIIGVHAVENRPGGYTRAPLDPDQLRPFTDMVLRAREEHRWGVVVIVERRAGRVGHIRARRDVALRAIPGHDSLHVPGEGHRGTARPVGQPAGRARLAQCRGWGVSWPESVVAGTAMYQRRPRVLNVGEHVRLG